MKKVKDNISTFVKWWIVFLMSCFGLIVFGMKGGFELVYSADVTNISFLILLLYLSFSIRTGLIIYKFRKNNQCDLQKISRQNELSLFVAEKFLTLGMIGTVIGFIYMLMTGLSGVDVNNPQTMRDALMLMSQGMGTALFTTASGLIFGLLLKIQTFMVSTLVKRSYDGRQ